MKSPNPLRALILIGIAAAAVWLLWPSEERRIRARLYDLAVMASTLPGESNLDRLARAAALARGLTPDAELDPGHGRQPIAGREAIAALASRTSLDAWTVRLEDVAVTLDEPERATAHAVVVFEPREGTRSPADVQEVQFALRKMDGEWLVQRAAVIQAIQRPQ